jgi:hypothetical protein
VAHDCLAEEEAEVFAGGGMERRVSREPGAGDRLNVGFGLFLGLRVERIDARGR